MKSRKLRPNYSEEEIIALVENYQELSFYFREKQYIAVRLMDIERTLPKLHKAERTAVFLCGVMAYNYRAAGELTGVSKDTMSRRYAKGLVDLFGRINGIK